jgi:hypothetical protein
MGVTVLTFMQLGAGDNFYVLLFRFVYLAWCDFAMDPTQEQRVCIKFCADLEKGRRRPWQWLDKRSGKKAWAVHGKFKLTETEKGDTGEEQSASIISAEDRS